jgi:hypothetical protein
VISSQEWSPGWTWTLHYITETPGPQCLTLESIEVRLPTTLNSIPWALLAWEIYVYIAKENGIDNKLKYSLCEHLKSFCNSFVWDPFAMIIGGLSYRQRWSESFVCEIDWTSNFISLSEIMYREMFSFFLRETILIFGTTGKWDECWNPSVVTQLPLYLPSSLFMIALKRIVYTTMG